MGFFSKIWKGLKKTVKKIGKGIKSAFKKFGKFMGKIGILGQVAMMFILPGIGAALGNAFMGTAGALATNTVGGVLGAVGQAAGKVMQFVGNTVSKAGNVFSNITKGVTDTLGNFAKTASNKMFGTSFDAASNFFTGGDSAFSRSFGGDSRFQNLTTDFSKVSKMVDEDIGDPFRSTEQTLAEKIQGTSLDTPRLADGSIDHFAIDPNMPIDSSILEATGKGVAEKAVVEPESWIKKQVGAGVDKFVKTATDIPSQLLNKSFGINQPGDVEYNQYAAYVPSFDVAPLRTYGAPEIMNARSFEQQVTNNPSPYGYTAFQYGNYMAQFGQTA
jgi:hypothetical protein